MESGDEGILPLGKAQLNESFENHIVNNNCFSSEYKWSYINNVETNEKTKQ